MSRAADGYVLSNRRIRVVVDPDRGDVLFFGMADGSRDALAGARLSIACSATDGTTPTTGPAGFLQARDEQTWEYIGEDQALGSGTVRWRKLYTLDANRLLVSFVLENRGQKPLDGTMVLRAIGPNVPGHVSENGDVFIEDVPPTTHSGARRISIQIKAYNLSPQPAPASPGLLQSDPFILAPGQRIAWTQVWRPIIP
jgi:hypothetical protein